MSQLKHQGEWEIMLLITAELAFLCINRSMLGYKDMPELKIEENQSLVLSFTYAGARRAKMFICHSVAHLPCKGCCTGHRQLPILL